jgi:spore maturation protein CgeB
MRIAYIGKFNTLWSEEGIARALESAGAEVIRIPEQGENHIVLVRNAKPDVVLTTKMQFTGAWKFLAAMREDKIPTVSWTFDLLIGHPERENLLTAFSWLSCDYIYLTDGGHDAEYKAKGIEKRVLYQGIPDELCYRGEPDERFPHDIVFVGTSNPVFPYRQDTMRHLQRTYGNKFHWYGAADANEIRGHELNRLYASAKIVIGDSVASPRYWSNRLWETLGRGGFCIFPRIEGLEEVYTPYKHYIPYDWGDYDGLSDKIDYYLTHDAERNAIQQAAYEHTKSHHCMSHRAKKLLCELESLSHDTTKKS